MTMTLAASPHAAEALALVRALQRRMVDAMQAIGGPTFEDTAWLRDGGRHGGGDRWSTGGSAVFDRASVNVSQVHYDDDPDKQLSSATALSTIIHPAHPRAPSVHIHVSWTELRHAASYWRVMADLNPSIEDPAATRTFVARLQAAAPGVFAEAAAQGDRYFWIPALGRHRGVAHFYLEDYHTDRLADDAALARAVGGAAIDTYAELVRGALAAHGAPTADERARQLAYHTAYLFQVLTLDRGTTSGLLVHDQNDVGILGSLPSHIDRGLLASWAAKVTPPVDGLVRALVDAIPAAAGDAPSPVDAATKQALAGVVRGFYRAHPEAIAMQAQGNVIPPTVKNHR
ncbi:MAG TPA: coproporphyrinogen III oxidase [Kofleriaceae bacterium]|nr:coproporphyrinogen III oxidase [Kofleriaceae bacterium]